MMTHVCLRCGAHWDITIPSEASVIARRSCTIANGRGQTCGGYIDRSQLESERVVTGAEPVPRSDVYGPDAAEAMLRKVTFQRGGTFPGGRCSAVLWFTSEDERAEFAGLVSFLGGKVTA